jgi:hypothetical protein
MRLDLPSNLKKVADLVLHLSWRSDSPLSGSSVAACLSFSMSRSKRNTPREAVYQMPGVLARMFANMAWSFSSEMLDV